MYRSQPQSEKEKEEYRVDCSDVESQRVDRVHYVSMSIPAFLAWHVLSFLLGILTTVLVIWMGTGCSVWGFGYLLRPWG